MSAIDRNSAPLINSDFISQEGRNERAVTLYRSYWYRWYILFAFSLFGFVQTLVWNTWGPVSLSAKVALELTDHDIELFANWATIAGLPCFPLFVFLLHRKGLRFSVVLGALCCAVGTALRCLPVNTDVLKYLIHVGQFMNGLAACPVLAVAPMISIVWFPPRERVTATTSMMLLGNIGSAFSFFLGAQMVDNPTNSTSLKLHPLDQGNENFTNISNMRKQISHLMYLHCGLAVFVVLCFLAFFPNEPPTPPSPSAAIQRLPFVIALNHLIRVPSYWVIIATTASIMGAYNGWSGVLADLYSYFNISEDESDFIGTVMTLAGVFVGVMIGWFVDRFKRQMKNIAAMIVCVIFIVFLYLVVASMQWIDWPFFHFSHVTLWVCCVIIGVAVSSFFPLAVELAVDHAYPVSEGTSNSILQWFALLSMFVFLSILDAVMDQRIANYLLLGFTGISIPFFLLLVPQRSARLDVDLRDEENIRRYSCFSQSEAYASIEEA